VEQVGQFAPDVRAASAGLCCNRKFNRIPLPHGMIERSSRHICSQGPQTPIKCDV